MNTPNVQTHQHPDLFPATLLVSLRDGRAETDSLKVAKHFHKRHKNVLRDIERLIEAYAQMGLTGLNFEPSTYRDSTGRELRMYLMDRKAFSILVTRFTGNKALAWCDEFFNAFESMEHALTQMTLRFASVVDVVCPSLRPTVEGTEAGLNRAAIAQRLGKSCSSVTYHRGRARQFGLLTSKGSKA